VALLSYLLLSSLLLLPVMMNTLARRSSVGRVSLHPEHGHAAVVASRYMIVSLLACFGVPLLVNGAVLGASWSPVLVLAGAGAVGLAALGRGDQGRDADAETWVHVFFGGLTGILLVANGMALARILGMLWGVLDAAPIGPGLGVVVLANMLVQSVAYTVFCTPIQRRGGAGGPGTGPKELDVDPWRQAARGTWEPELSEHTEITDSGAA
jgi:hypothetical protein